MVLLIHKFLKGISKDFFSPQSHQDTKESFIFLRLFVTSCLPAGRCVFVAKPFLDSRETLNSFFEIAPVYRKSCSAIVFSVRKNKQAAACYCANVLRCFLISVQLHTWVLQKFILCFPHCAAKRAPLKRQCFFSQRVESSTEQQCHYCPPKKIYHRQFCNEYATEWKYKIGNFVEIFSGKKYRQKEAATKSWRYVFRWLIFYRRNYAVVKGRFWV